LAPARDVIGVCRELAAFSEEPGATTRRFLSPPMRDVHARLGAWMENTGMTVTVDAAGNLRGLYPAESAAAPRLLIGSHLDTVPHAGAFDGILGVALGIALVDLLGGRRLPLAIEVVGFSEEEGVRFSVPFIGSRALAGTVDDDLLHRRDGEGVSVREALVDFGLDPARLSEARANRAIGYLEFHIEQGPVLDRLSLPLGVVTAIAGQTRAEVTFTGAANHAGTTPMSARRDALAAAAEWIGLVERDARSVPDLVATIGRIDVAPGAANVVPGRAIASLDVRHADDAVRRATAERLVLAAREAGDRRGVGVTIDIRLDQRTVPMDEGLTAMVARAVERSGATVHRMASGAGHDAMILAPVMPVAMLFLRSPGGVSHHPDETVLEGDVASALAAGGQLLDDLATHHPGLRSPAESASSRD
jgi:allantoate deiminase